MPSIGSLNEKPLHASLKACYAQPGDQLEARVDGYVIDILRGELLLEIQTGSFASIKSKIIKLAQTHPIRVIYPIPVEKWILKPEGQGWTRRRSPRRGRVEDLFREMVSFPQLLAHPNFSLEVLFIREEELRRYDAQRLFRRRGWVIQERRLLEVTGNQVFESPSDWLRLLPERCLKTFTVRDLAEASGLGMRLAGRMAYCLRKAGCIEPIGKRGRAVVYGTIKD
jgi:hypothetical protein